MNLRARIRRLAERVNALSLRERGLLLLAVLAVTFLLWDFLVMQPINQRREAVQGQLEQQRERLARLNASIQQLASAQSDNADVRLAEEADKLSSEIEGLRQRLTKRFGGIATPQQSIAVLASLVGDRAGVDIVSLENFPPQRLEGPSGQPVPGLFVHRVRVVIETDHSGMRSYLRMIEQLPAGVFWESMNLSVPEWPLNRVELVLYSLALDDHWLGV